MCRAAAGHVVPSLSGLRVLEPSTVALIVKEIGDQFREGSSLDDRVVAFMTVTIAAGKLGRDPEELNREMEATVHEILRRNEVTVRRIARELVARTPLKVKGPQLQELLVGVE
jgi:hypothetical protein